MIAVGVVDVVGVGCDIGRFCIWWMVLLADGCFCCRLAYGGGGKGRSSIGARGSQGAEGIE